jgi:catechol 2,3-dioxygenase-like lactoylglutathione lyase family enzyme
LPAFLPANGIAGFDQMVNVGALASTVDGAGSIAQEGAMTQSIATITLVVADYDEAIAFYTRVLGFSLIADLDLGGGKRWVLIAPDGSAGARLLLAEADGAEQAAHVGNQTGGRVGFFLETEDFARDHAAYVAPGVRFLEEPRREPYGTVAVFEDLYGNKWDLIEPGA